MNKIEEFVDSVYHNFEGNKKRNNRIKGRNEKSFIRGCT